MRVSTEYRSHPGVRQLRREEPFLQLLVSWQEAAVGPAEFALQCPLLGLALAGAGHFVEAWPPAQAAIVLLYILYIPAVQSPIIAHARHSVLIVPFLAILAASPLCRLGAH